MSKPTEPVPGIADPADNTDTEFVRNELQSALKDMPPGPDGLFSFDKPIYFMDGCGTFHVVDTEHCQLLTGKEQNRAQAKLDLVTTVIEVPEEFRDIIYTIRLRVAEGVFERILDRLIVDSSDIMVFQLPIFVKDGVRYHYLQRNAMVLYDRYPNPTDTNNMLPIENFEPAEFILLVNFLKHYMFFYFPETLQELGLSQ